MTMREREVWGEPPEEPSADPPEPGAVPQDIGADGEGGPARGGTAGGGMTAPAVAPPHMESLWDQVVEHPAACLSESMEDTEVAWRESKLIAAASMLQVLNRLRAELDRTPIEASSEDPIVVRAADAVLIARHLLRKLA